MTMICIRTRPDRIEVMTDSLAYSSLAQQVTAEHTEKACEIPGVGLVASRGKTIDGAAWKEWAHTTAEAAAGFDVMRLAAPFFLFPRNQAIRKLLAAAGQPGDMSLNAYLCGYSPKDGRMVSLVAAAETGWRLEPIEDVHLTPAPTGTRPTRSERRRFATAGMLPDGLSPDDPSWEELPTPARPDSDQDWIDLAQQIHATRATVDDQTGLKMLMGGEVWLTTLTRDGVARRRLFTFSAEQHQAMLAYTLHPSAQYGPCPCSSGGRYIDCCLTGPDTACPCGTGKTFADCCRVSTAQAMEMGLIPPLARADTIGRNDPCPCAPGQKHKRCCALVPA